MSEIQVEETHIIEEIILAEGVISTELDNEIEVIELTSAGIAW